MAGFLDKDTGLPYFWSKLKVLFGSKTDKVSGATNGNFAGLDANGNLTDSGHKHSDYKAASAHDSWSDVTNKPFTSLGQTFDVGYGVLNPKQVDFTNGEYGGSQNSYGAQYIGWSNVNNGAALAHRVELNGTKYFEIVSTTSTTTYTFSNSVFTMSSLVIRDICTNIWGDIPTNVVVNSTAGTLTITFATSAVRTVRVYFDV